MVVKTISKWSMWLGLVGMSSLLAPPVLADLNEGLVAYYPFNGNANDESGNGNDGTVNGATVTVDRFGNTDSAYHINGNGNATDSVQLPYTIINGLINITSSVWIKSSNNEQAILSGAGGDSHNQYLVFVKLGGVESCIKDECFYVGSVNDGQWHNIVVVRDGSSGFVQVFIDGNLANAQNLPAGMLSIDANGFWVGREQDCVGGCFESSQDFLGAIDDIRIYNRTLSQSEVQELYQLGSVPSSTSTKTYEDGLNEGIAKCQNDPASCEITIPPESGNCSADIAAVIGEDLSLHVSKAQYNTLTGTQILWIDLTFGGENEAGDLTWILSDYGEVK